MKTPFIAFVVPCWFVLEGKALPLLPMPKTCLEIMHRQYCDHKVPSGVYEIDPDGKGPFKVFCDMETDGGGWTVFQRRHDGSVDFYRSWNDYKIGFGNLLGEFWQGNDKVHRITAATPHKLRVDMEDFEFNTRYAEYRSFATANEVLKYKLTVSGYSGNAGDSFSSHNNQKFSTKDQDNDAHTGNCATSYKGGWWYSSCHSSNLNGLYLRGSHASYANGVNWYAWRQHHYSLKVTEMKIRPVQF